MTRARELIASPPAGRSVAHGVPERARTVRRGADVVIQALARAGVTRIFTLSGNHIMPLFDAALDAGIHLLHTRHEAAAVHMADAWARLTGEPGIAMVTGGPGHANAVPALYTALLAESPVVLLSGQAPSTQRGWGAFQEMRQEEMAAPVTKAAWTCDRAAALGVEVARAIATARAGRPGPVQLNLTIDALEAAAETETPLAPDAFDLAAQPLQPDEARAALDRLLAAARPIVLTGPASVAHGGRVRLRRLEDSIGVPVVPMESPRGTRDPALGTFGDQLAEADCVLLLGKRMDYVLAFGTSPTFAAGCAFLQVDADTSELERTARAVDGRLTMAAEADLVPGIMALLAASRGRRHRDETWLAQVRGARAYRPAAWSTARSDRPGLLHPAAACRPIRTLLDSHPDSVVILDGGEFGQWAQGCLDAPNRVINGPGGSIGGMLPMALAARLAKPDAPIVTVMGDGAFGFHLSEFDTAARYGLPFIAVVGNDARWNAEYQLQLRAYGADRALGCDLLPTRYDRVVAAFGAHGEYVDDPQALPAAVERAHRSGRPACLNIAIDGVPAPVLQGSHRR